MAHLFDEQSILLTDRVAIVTGAAQGIGRATALLFARCGASLALCDRQGPEMAAVAAEIEAMGRPVITAELDVRDAPAVDTFVRRLHSVMVARSYVLVDYDIHTALLEEACRVTPGLESPTVSSLHDPVWSAVRAMVPAADVHRIMDELYDMGARGILVTDIHACRL